MLVDGVGPRTAARKSLTARKGKKVTFSVRVTDVSPTALVSVKVFKGKRIKKALKAVTLATNSWQKAAWKRCSLAPGKYTWKVYAVDAAGNHSQDREQEAHREVTAAQHSRETAMPDHLAIDPLDPADIELVGPLWKQLMDHVAALPDGLVPVRPSDESWELERAEMLRELAGEAFVLVARKEGRVAGYAFVCVEGPDPVWYTGDKHAVLATLCVDEAERGGGIGSALMDAVDAELERRGIEDVEIGVDTGNEIAARLYRSRGYRPDFHLYYGSPGGRPWACLRREAEDEAAGRGRFAPPGPEAKRT